MAAIISSGNGPWKSETTPSVRRRVIKLDFVGPDRFSVTRYKLFPFLYGFAGKSIQRLTRRNKATEWFLTLDSEELAEELHEEGFKDLSTKLSVYFSLINKVRTSVRVHWLPEEFGCAFLTRFFADYGKVINVEEDVSKEEFDKGCFMGSYNVQLEMNYEDIASIPHLVNITGRSSSFPLLFTLPGRPPLCLKCLEVGHVRKECSGSTKMQAPLTSYRPARKSYSDAVSNNKQASTYSDDEEEIEQEMKEMEEAAARDDWSQQNPTEGKKKEKGTQPPDDVPPAKETDQAVPVHTGSTEHVPVNQGEDSVSVQDVPVEDVPVEDVTAMDEDSQINVSSMPTNVNLLNQEGPQRKRPRSPNNKNIGAKMVRDTSRDIQRREANNWGTQVQAIDVDTDESSATDSIT